VINGVKNWITSADKASVYLLIAQTNPGIKTKGINAFIVDRNSPGISLGPHEDKMGLRSSDTHSVMFTDVIVPKENLICEDGFGFRFAMKLLEGGRTGIAAQALGIAEGAYERALKYSKERKAFGTEIINHQAIAFKIADMATRIEAARHLVYKAAWLKDNSLPYGTASSMAKLFAADTAMWVTTEAVQVHGGYGYVKEYHVERLMREAKITQIYEGTDEIQRIVIARALSKD
jgi:alkylation response protein AidB-like acyl-CoA dehydrogenase